MKKILHLTPPDINNGVYRYIFNHMKYMDRQAYRFAFLTKNPAGLQNTDEFRKYSFPVHALCSVERDDPDSFRKEIVRILGTGYDAIHLHTSYWRGFLIEEIAMELGLPQVIVHSHSTGIDVPGQEERMGLLEKHEAFKARFGPQYATDLCACSEMAGEWLYGKQIPKDSIHILRNAIEVERYHFHPQIRKEKREEWGLEGRLVIGNIGRYCYQKNQDFLLRVFARAHRRNPRLFLLLIGQGELLPELKRTAGYLGIGDDVLFLGLQEHVEEYLQAMYVFCLPSRFEVLAISAVESQTEGLPCLMADTVSRETAITDLARFLPLEEEVWEEALIKYPDHFCRERLDERIAESGYDIRQAARSLERLYD